MLFGGGALSRRQAAAYEEPARRPVLLAVLVGVIGLVVLSLVVITLFAWSQWVDGWPILQRNGPISVVYAESGLALTEQPTHIDPKASDSGDLLQPEIEPAPPATNWPIEPKNILASSAPGRARWTPTPIATNTPIPTPSAMPTFVSETATGGLQPDGLRPGEKWIDVNVSTQTLVAYEGSAPVYNALVSTGTANHPTVTGQFRIWLRFRSQDMNGYRLGYDYYLKGVPYVQYFYQDYALHGTFWHSNFGHPMSHGCVNLSPADAEWLFHWAEYGTLVNIHK
jgi:lipoprotein-anchoring transpeptidase ErfK/SrfK